MCGGPVRRMKWRTSSNIGDKLRLGQDVSDLNKTFGNCRIQRAA